MPLPLTLCVCVCVCVLIVFASFWLIILVSLTTSLYMPVLFLQSGFKKKGSVTSSFAKTKVWTLV